MMFFQKNQVSIESLLDRVGQFEDALCLLTEKERAALNSLVGYINRFECAFPAQGTIAKKIGCSRKLVNEAFGWLHSVGLIRKYYRHMDSCIYELPSLFWNTSVRKYLSQYIYAFKYFPIFKIVLTSLFAFNGSIFHRNMYKGGYTEENIVNTEESHFSWKEFWHINMKREVKQRVQPNTTIFLKNWVVQEPDLESHSAGFENLSGSTTTIEAKEEMLIPDYIENITEVVLGRAQKLELVACSEGAVMHVRRRVREQAHLDNPAAWFVRVCKLEHEKRKSSAQQATTKPPKEVKAPSEWKPQSGYDRAAYMQKQRKMDEYLARVTKKPIEIPEHIEHYDDIAASWNRPVEILMRQREEGLARVKDPEMKKYLANLFDECLLQHNVDVRSALGLQSTKNESE